MQTLSHRPTILVVDDPELAVVLADRLPRIRVREVATVDEAEGGNIDLVVVSGPEAVHELRSLRVHPRLSGVPIVALSSRPDARLHDADIVLPGPEALEQIVSRSIAGLRQVPDTLGSAPPPVGSPARATRPERALA